MNDECIIEIRPGNYIRNKHCRCSACTKNKASGWDKVLDAFHNYRSLAANCAYFDEDELIVNDPQTLDNGDIGDDDILPLPGNSFAKEDEYILNCPGFDCEDCLPLPPSLEVILGNEKLAKKKKIKNQDDDEEDEDEEDEDGEGLASNRCDDDPDLLPLPSIY